MDKTTRILNLYNRLSEGQNVDKTRYCMENDITERTFDRDIEDIRMYLSEEQPYCALEYDRINKSYNFSHRMQVYLPSEFILFLVDLIMSMKIGSEDETEAMILLLYKYCETCKQDIILNYIKNNADIRKRMNGSSILKMHWDLERAIQNHKLIEMQYEISESVKDSRKVKPVQVLVNNGYPYLIGFLVDKEYENPAFFRLDRIYSFKILPEKFAEEISKKYLGRAKKYNVYNMIAGEELSVKVQVKKNMKRIVRDVFPDSKLLEENEGIYTIEIKTRKQGFLQWVLGQDQYIKVIEPECLKEEIIDICKKKIMLYEERGDVFNEKD